MIIFSSNLISISKSISIKKNNHDGSKNITNINSEEIVKKCMMGLIDSIPPQFCWKKGGDFGRFPKECPQGYIKYGVLCYKNCEPGYTFSLGICWEICRKDYKDYEVSCFKNVIDIYFKASYVPKPLTYFSKKINCAKDFYKSGMLCFHDCEAIGMRNCGIGACAINAESCSINIKNIVFDTVLGIANGITTVLTLGSSKGVYTIVREGFDTLGTAGVIASLNYLKTVFKSKLKEHIIKMATEKTINSVRFISEGKLNEQTLTSICLGVWSTAINKIINSPTKVSDILIKTVDIFNVKGISENCSKTKNKKDSIACTINILKGLSTFDPTGIITVTSAFIKPSCDLSNIKKENK
jgi:hypothetical protein